MRLALLAALLGLPAPLAAQRFPPECMVVRQCAGETCTDVTGVTLRFESSPTGLVTWDTSAPNDRLALTALPGDGPDAWVGRAEDRPAVVLLTRTRLDRAVLTMQGTGGTELIFWGELACVQIQPPGPAPVPPPLTK